MCKYLHLFFNFFYVTRHNYIIWNASVLDTPKYGIYIAHYYGYDYICLSAIFTHNNILYIINKNTHKKQLYRDVKVLQNLKNKDSALYSELLFAINKFNSGRCNYMPSDSVSKKILHAAGIKHPGYFKITIYGDKCYYDTYDGDMLLNLKSEHLPIINFGY